MYVRTYVGATHMPLHSDMISDIAHTYGYGTYHKHQRVIAWKFSSHINSLLHCTHLERLAAVGSSVHAPTNVVQRIHQPTVEPRTVNHGRPNNRYPSIPIIHTTS